MTKHVVLFDVDGTLVDSNDFHAEAWQRTFAYFGCELPYARVRSQIGKGADNLMPALLSPDFLRANREKLETYRKELFAREYMDRIRPFPGVRALFERVRSAGLEIVLASSGTAEEVDHHLKLIGAEGLVRFATTADDAAHSKPQPDIFASALARLDGMPAGEAIVVGDSPYDMLAAGALGIDTIGFRCGGFADDVLVEAGCGELYDDASALLARFESSLLARTPIPV